MAFIVLFDAIVLCIQEDSALQRYCHLLYDRVRIILSAQVANKSHGKSYTHTTLSHDFVHGIGIDTRQPWALIR